MGELNTEIGDWGRTALVSLVFFNTSLYSPGSTNMYNVNKHCNEVMMPKKFLWLHKYLGFFCFVDSIKFDFEQ